MTVFSPGPLIFFILVCLKVLINALTMVYLQSTGLHECAGNTVSIATARSREPVQQKHNVNK